MSDPNPSTPETGTVEVIHDRAQIDRAVALVTDAVLRRGYPESARFAIRLALEEALSNAFRHGHRGLPPDTPVRLEFRVDADEVELAVEDRGPGFDPATVPDPTLDENLEVPSGRGLMLMRAYMARIAYNAPGNRVTMVYRRPPAAP